MQCTDIDPLGSQSGGPRYGTGGAYDQEHGVMIVAALRASAPNCKLHGCQRCVAVCCGPSAGAASWCRCRNLMSASALGPRILREPGACPPPGTGQRSWSLGSTELAFAGSPRWQPE